MSGLPRALHLYWNVTCAYALAHAVPYAWSHRSTKELLVVDKMLLIVGGALSGPLIWPLFVRDDLVRVECLVRGKRARDYLSWQ